ncbi:PREDICTED: zinc finger and SCAN domain-containing protein 21-like [Gekko japonicus]|uniref:Zinc finger and SCAN domain-containing protein 21-like n=1 Tax=Gekko japonicus TaxID=146911 RepID=A0ABM1JSB5_GEKJA|nr:PREDICTED: zinc finger and SCAN domain-containing protein 21-like [Gekko japonicus]
MASTQSWEVAAFDPEFQAAFAEAMGKPTGPELDLGGHGDGVQSKPYEKTLQCWELEFQEFLDAEDWPWEDSRLQDGLSPWENTETFLASFQQVAQACRWPQKEWVTRLLPALDEEAEKAFRSLDEEDQHNFWKVKRAILQREAINRERKRQQFRRFCYQEANGPREVFLHLQYLCHQWLKVERQSKEQILEQLILEQFLSILPKEMQAWVRERCPVTCNRAVTLAEDFLRKLLAAEGKEGQHLQELENAALDYSKPKVSQQGRDLPWVQKEINLDTSASRKSYPSRDLPWAQKAINGDSRSSRRSYPNYDDVKRSRKKSLERGRSEPVERCPKPRGRPPRASPYPVKKEWRRRSERLRKPSPSPPREETRKKFRRASLPPETPRDRTKICPECGQSFSGLSSFMRHQARHTGEKRYECCFCGRGFCWRSDLVRHETIHTGKKPHECQFCGEGFDRKWQRERHELGHAKVRRRL